MLQVCKSKCSIAHRCLAHQVTTPHHFREKELVEFEPELKEECCGFWDASEEDDTDSH